MVQNKQTKNREVNNFSNLRQDQRELLSKIVEDKGELVCNEDGEGAKDLQYGEFLVVDWWKENGWRSEDAVVRVLQVREEQGDFGTSLLVVRRANGECGFLESVSLSKVKEKYLDDLELIYNTHDAIEIDDDHMDMGYTIDGVKKVGFFIPSSEF